MEGEWCYVRKFVGSQIRATPYKVKQSECYSAHRQLSETLTEDDCSVNELTDEDDDSYTNTSDHTDNIPQIPEILSAPLDSMIDSTPDVSTEPEQNITEALPRRSTRQKTRIVYPK